MTTHFPRGPTQTHTICAHRNPHRMLTWLRLTLPATHTLWKHQKDAFPIGERDMLSKTISTCQFSHSLEYLNIVNNKYVGSLNWDSIPYSWGVVICPQFHCGKMRLPIKTTIWKCDLLSRTHCAPVRKALGKNFRCLVLSYAHICPCDPTNQN